MEKNVGGIDLEELRKAREELMQERAETGEAPVSAFEPVQETSVDSFDSGYAEEPASSVIDNPNVSRVFEREAPKPKEEQPEEDDFGLDLDALVNEVFNGGYEDVSAELEEGEEIDIDAMIDDGSSELIDELSKVVSDDEDEHESNYASEPQTVNSEPVVAAEEPARDFSVYDSFAAFEVNDGAFAAPAAEPEQAEISSDLDRFAVENAVSEPDDLSAKLDALMDDLSEDVEQEEQSEEHQTEFDNFAVQEDSQSEPAYEEPVVQEQEDMSAFDRFAVESSSEEPQTIRSVEEYAESEDGSLASLGAFDFDQPKPEPQPVQEPEQETVEDVSPETEDVVVENTIATDMETSENTSDETEASEEPATDDSLSMISSLDDLEKMMREDEERAAHLDEEIQRLEQQVQTGEILDEESEETEKEQPVAGSYPTIEPYKFVDVIDEDEFKDSDKLTYVLGKDEQGKVHYGNLRDNYNVVVFGKENEYNNNLVHSMLLSLILKNTVNEVNFVICDSKADSKFEVYNKSSYMYFNRIAKTNKEILDILIELNKELEERYKLLAEIGVKSIEQYNIIAKNDNLKPLPYIVTVFNNYSKAIQLTESDKINTCLYQILKFGRIAGMYIILVANNTIMSNEINYNLPTRLSFKSEDSEMSLTTLGEDGAENLSTDGDFLFSTVGVDGLVHLKVASLTSNEIELLIENIED